MLISHRYRPEEVWGWPGGVYRGWTTAFLRVVSDDGCEGIGEIGDGLNFPEAIQPIVDRFVPGVVGRPARPRAIVAALESSAPGWGVGGLVSSVISGIEIAIIDLIGKRAGVPAQAVLGGAYRDNVPAYASGGLTVEPKALQDELTAYLRAGYRAVKIRIGHGFDLDLRRVEAAREAVGAVRPDPAVERVAADLPWFAGGGALLLGGDAPDEEAALPAAEPRVEGLGDYAE